MYDYKAAPLPSPKSSQILQQPWALQDFILDAYTLCYEEDQRRATAARTKVSLVHIRLLGWMFVFCAGYNILEDLAAAVSSCHGDFDKYDHLGKFFVDQWIKRFRNNRRPPDDDSVQWFKTITEQVQSSLEPFPDSHVAATRNALIRDGYRCVLSGNYDTKSTMCNAELYAKFKADVGTGMDMTECARIILPPSSDSDIGRKECSMDLTSAWTVLDRLAHDDLFAEVDGTGMYGLQNVITFSVLYCNLFENLRLWLDPVDDFPDSHRYKIGACDPDILCDLAHIDAFELSNWSPGGILRMPSKLYLSLHAVSAKVANMSGAADYLERLDNELEMGRVLAHDGTSAELLDHALRDVCCYSTKHTTFHDRFDLKTL